MPLSKCSDGSAFALQMRISNSQAAWSTIPIVAAMRSRRGLKLVALAGGLVAVVVGGVLATSSGRNAAWSTFTRIRGRHTIESRLSELGETARSAMRAKCEAAGLAYPPACIAIVVLKQERMLYLLGQSASSDSWRRIAKYPVLAASGTLGPKLREGDKQVPEGVYRIESLNPNSRFHLSLRVNYPSDDDRRIAREENRTNLGGDIMIHGGAASIGCVASGDPAIEDVFVLAADTGIETVEIVLAPSRNSTSALTDTSPAWLKERYGVIHERLIAMEMQTP